ncbi:hypothetical protein [Streptomyces sp. TLI_146]|uniref:hypothetical protein n=1 Tax=Streptomyces sp. TLI_146 TaxID=1938858 RepID=UPI000C70F6BD|nr:hypothetical protein [Streptomyces sp. TLI_146]PKV83497.1 hypothetical protein BX283_1002 [Streptomyces sp. TLI_146]
MSTPTTVSPAYLDWAHEQRIRAEIANHVYVAGAQTDPVTQELSCLVEYAAPELLAAPSALAELEQRLAAVHPGATALLLRAPGDTPLPAPWRPSVSYVRYTGAVPRAPRPSDGLAVTPAGPEHDTLILDWLARAITDGYGPENIPAAELIDAAAANVLDAPDRVSFLLTRDGRPVGHASVLTEAHDEVTGTEFIDLFDLLVEESDVVRPGTAALVAACAAFAAERELPLFGNVVHDGTGPDSGARVVASLLERGWSLDHRFWRRPRPDEETSV